MINHNRFNYQYQDQPRSSSNNKQQVLDIMQKYERRQSNSTNHMLLNHESPQKDFYHQSDAKQVKSNLQGYRISYGQRDSNQVLQKINESNLSQVLSDLSIFTDTYNDNDSQFLFRNPIGLQYQNTIPLKLSQQLNDRITFGQNYPQNQSPIKVEMNQSQKYDLYDDMSYLKDKILDLLQLYNSKESNTNQGLKEVKQKVKQNAKVIAKEYSQIVDKLNQSDITNISMESYTEKKEKELSMMCNLVEQFLTKFNEPVQNSLLQTRMQSETNDQQERNKKIEQSKQSEITIIQNFPTEDSFYQNKQITLDKLAAKIMKLKQNLENQLNQSSMPHSKQILIQMIKNLNDILLANDPETIKSVVYRIEQGIQTLNLEDQASLKLYNYMAKAIKSVKKKLGTDSNKSLKRKFFDQALKIKGNLDPTHPGKQMMVSILYDEFLKEKRNEYEMEMFIKQRLFC